MTWVKIDDSWLTHPKALHAGRDGRALWIAALCYSARELTDGFLPEDALPLVAVAAGVRSGPAMAKLTSPWKPGANPSFEPVDGGWMIHDFNVYQPSSEKVRDVKAKRAEAGRRGGSRSKGSSNDERPDEANHQAKAEANGQANRKRNGTPSPSPLLPTQVSSPTGLGTAPPPTDDDDELIEAIIRARYARIHKPEPTPRLIAAVAKSLDHQRIRTLATQGHDPADIDQILDGCDTPPSQPVHPAVHATATPDCPDCVDGWIEHDGTVSPCGTCNRVVGT